MVCDRITYASEYFNLGPGIRTALQFLARMDLGRLQAGRHAIEGDAVFALVSEYDTRSPADGFWEAHRRHVDVQFVVSGRERIAVGDLSAFESEPYDAERDLIVARGTSEQSVVVGPGEFVVLFPHDVHMPGLSAGAVARVRKVVVKVRIA